jgi:hypothetical protein
MVSNIRADCIVSLKKLEVTNPNPGCMASKNKKDMKNLKLYCFLTT